MSLQFNGALAQQVMPALRASSPGLNIYCVDVGAFDGGSSRPIRQLRLTNVTAPCYPFFSAPSAPICATPGTYFYWDELHPTCRGHATALPTRGELRPIG